ncbi:MAG: alpha/beta hydrolase [Prevotella sp.]|nr:alpha/beta hydrolase [Bacteroides sp.]MCM1366924.1 alpha/beta hydrolase [Prevotella sp.]MCM1437455.1 alpha/beta hydrolase [Prevotella sp.]
MKKLLVYIIIMSGCILTLCAKEESEGIPVEVKHQDREIVIMTPHGVLTGTFTFPLHYKGSVPAVLLLNGSGSQDRDETIGGYKPFKTVAEGLASAGIASLRFDDRGVGGSVAPRGEYGYKELLEDAYIALDSLRNCKDINRQRVGILGHSEGGSIAIELAADYPEDVSSVVVIGCPLLPGKEIMIRQNELISDAMGKLLTESMHAALSAIFDAVETGNEDKIAYSLERYGSEAGMRAETIPMQLKILSSPEYVEMVRRDYGAKLGLVKVPVLGLWGEWDVQVDPDANLLVLKDKLPEGRVKKIACANHLMQQCSSKDMSLYYMAPGREFSPEALRDILIFFKETL